MIKQCITGPKRDACDVTLAQINGTPKRKIKVTLQLRVTIIDKTCAGNADKHIAH